MPNMKLSDWIAANGNREIVPEELEKIVKKPGAWRPETNQQYFWNDFGCVRTAVWYGSPIDQRRLAHNNCFQTEAECAADDQRKLVTAALERAAEEAGGVEWKDHKAEKWYLLYEHIGGYLKACYNTISQPQGIVYFPSEQSCRAAIAQIGEDRIKRAIFGVTP